MRALVTAVYLFLYAPIALVVLFSFNAGRSASEFTGFSVAWYGKALSNTLPDRGAAEQPVHRPPSAPPWPRSSAPWRPLGMERMGPRSRTVFDGLFAAAIVVPGVVIGIATLVALVAVFSAHQPVHRQHLARRPPTTVRARLRLDHRRPRAVLDGAGDDDRQGAHRQPRPRHRRGVERPLRDAARPPSARSCCRRSCRRSSPASCSPSPSRSTISSSPSSSRARTRRCRSMSLPRSAAA